MLLEKVRKFNEVQNLPTQEQLEKSKYLAEELKAFLDTFKYAWGGEKLGSIESPTELLEKFFFKESKKEKPLILDLWDALKDLYRGFYSNVPERNLNFLGVLAKSLKDQINVIFATFLNMVAIFVFLLVKYKIEAQIYQGIILYLAQEVIEIFDKFSLESDQISILLIQASLNFFFKLNECKMLSNFQFPLKVMQKLESLINFSYQKEFNVLFGNDFDSEFINNKLAAFCALLDTYFMGYDNFNFFLESKSLQIYLSRFETVDFISSKISNQESILTNQPVIKAHEKLIRSYMCLHLKTNLLAMSIEGVNTTNCYDIERMKQILFIISNYCKYESFIQEEFRSVCEILVKMEEEDPIVKEKLHEIFSKDVLISLFKNCFFKQCSLNINEAIDKTEILFPIFECLFDNKKDEYRAFWDELSTYIQEPFKDLVQEGETLQRLYEENHPFFYKQYFIIESKISEFDWVIDFFFKVIDPDNTEKYKAEIGFQKVFYNCLLDLVVSPVLFMIDSNIVTQILNFFFNEFSPEKLSNALLKFGEKVISFIKIVEDDLAQNQNLDFFQDKLGKVNVFRLLFDFRQKDSFDNDFRVSFKLKSNYFPVLFLTFYRGNTSATIPEEIIIPLVDLYRKELRSSITSLVNIVSFSIKRKLKEDLSFDLFTFEFFNDTCLGRYLHIPQVKEYFKEKLTILTDIFSGSDNNKTFEEDLIYRLSAFSKAKQVRGELSFKDCIDFWVSEGILEKNLNFALNTIENFQKLILENSSHGNEITHISEIEVKVKENGIIKNEGSLLEFWKLSAELLEAEFSTHHRELNQYWNYETDESLKNHYTIYFTTVWKILLEWLERIDQRILYFYSIEDEDHRLMRVIKSLYSCYQAMMVQKLTVNSKLGTPKSQMEEELSIKETLEEEKEFFKKIFLKFIIFLTPNPQAIRGDFEKIRSDALLEIFREINPCVATSGDILPCIKGFEARIYKNSIINRFRILVPLVAILMIYFKKCLKGILGDQSQETYQATKKHFPLYPRKLALL